MVQADEGEREAWAEAQRVCDPDGFFTYLSRYPTGEHVPEALAALSELGALQVAQGELSSSFCFSKVRELPPVVVPTQARPDPSESSDDPY